MRWFEGFILSLILIGSIKLAFDTYYTDEPTSSDEKKI